MLPAAGLPGRLEGCCLHTSAAPVRGDLTGCTDPKVAETEPLGLASPAALSLPDAGGPASARRCSPGSGSNALCCALHASSLCWGVG